jgi:hypothetical protein
MFKTLTSSFAALCIALLISGGASAQPSAPFEQTTTISGVPLKLHGSGTRYKVLFKVYDMAMYLREPAKTPDAAIALSGPKNCRSWHCARYPAPTSAWHSCAG